ncbi:GH39 family glycosyl hydrolase [Microbispora sp. ATCC PTA-5024]|uniref:GH39 family glycosyl hydrolase n=1 Tax=Microbispora sp. ATCC PTA-5024 TaxID=316330 RepID=UPI001E5B8F05|nr:xylan 1,4-beta-xylosidase [Microbispora sp. ATCC PTA-5024]
MFRRWAGTAVGVLVAGLLMMACSAPDSGATSGRATTGSSAGSGAATAAAVPDEAPAGGASSRWPVFGFTHTQYTADYGDDRALATARRAIAGQRLLQNQHIMGFGALNPEPSPGRFDFASLDDRMDLIRKTGGVPVVTLCCAPDWMKGGRAGRTDWGHIERAPTPDHYQDFADLAAKVAERYPYVTHFIVWNELKGFFDEGRHRWDYEGYTDMYNRVYKALKAVNPKIQVGGPYPVMADFDAPSELEGPWGNVDQRVLDVLRYWDKHKKGADFVVVDGSAETDQGMIPDDFGAQEKFSAVNQWLHKHIGLPIWWAEWYPEPDDSGWPDAKRAAVAAVSMIELTRTKSAAVLYWNRQEEGEKCPPGCLWTSPRQRGGGQPTLLLKALQGFARWFPLGVKTVPVQVSPASVRALGRDDMTVVVNTASSEVGATVNGKRLNLAPYEVRWVPRTSS